MHELLEDPVVSAALKTSCEQFSLSSLDDQTIKVRTLNSKAGRTACNVAVSPIGQDGNSITHYALELEDLEGHKYNGNGSTSQEINIRHNHTAACSQQSMGVMG